MKIYKKNISSLKQISLTCIKIFLTAFSKNKPIKSQISAPLKDPILTLNNWSEPTFSQVWLLCVKTVLQECIIKFMSLSVIG